MKTLCLIGIGTGSPEHLTRAGEAAIRACDTILVPRKGPEKDDLADLRLALIEAVDTSADVIPFDMPVRDAALPYMLAVDDWHDRIAARWRAAVPETARRVGLLVWGDPSLYDSTLRIAERLDPKPTIEVTPGITALQALTAAHAIPLNEIGAPVTITTGRQLRGHGWPDGASRIAVMLDGECSFQRIDPDGVTIWWGAHLSLPNQVLCAGPLSTVGPDIVRLRQEARAAHGWVMDTYLLSREPL